MAECMIDSTDDVQTYQLYSSVSQQEVEWLWYPYIAYGKITLLQGDPGDGKSTCMINIAAALSSGSLLPSGEKIEHPQAVIYQCAEDNASDTIKPRLVQAGADCDKVAFITDDAAELSLSDGRIEDTIQKLKARLLILDPVQAFIPQDADMQNAAKMRAVLRQLGIVAEKHHCAVVLIGHMTKSNSGKSLYRGLGSIDIAAVARSVLMISRDKKNPEIRYLSQIKNSLAPEGDSFAFVMHPEVGFQWLGKCLRAGDGDDYFTNVDSVRRKSKIEQAKEYLRLMLSVDDDASKDVIAKIKKMGIGERTVRSAVKEIGVYAYRKDNAWYWHMGKDSSGE